MASVSQQKTTHSSGNASPLPDYRVALVSLTSLFFIWGFITALNDILIPHLKAVFDLNYTQAMLVQFCFFGAYFLVSMPAGKFVERFGYRNGIATGLTVSAAGCLLFIPSAGISAYWLFLTALFVLASGITVLQVAANPLVTLLGPAKSSSARLNMSQAFNSLGTTVAPIIGGWLIFNGAAHTGAASADSVVVPYFSIAMVLLVLAAYFKFKSLPEARESKPEAPPVNESVSEPVSLFSHIHLVFGALCIFLYVGAEVAVGSFLINFLGEQNIAGMPESEAATYVAYFWGGAMVGRFIGAFLMRYIPSNRILAFNSFAAVCLLAVVISAEGSVAMYSVLALGLCNSIMFPTIFSLSIAQLGAFTSKGSGLLCLAIVGGAIVPLFQGMLADSIGLQASFILPLLCYVFIGYFGLKGYRPAVKTADTVVEGVH